jgi:hypothetical protein
MGGAVTPPTRGRVTSAARVACLGTIGCFLALASFSTGRTFQNTWSFLANQRESYASVTADEPNIVPEYQTLLPTTAVEFFSSRMRPGDRFYVHAGDGPFTAGVDYTTAVRTFARFQLLPAVLVKDPRQADVVLAIAADPTVLGLPPESIERSRDGRYAIARVAR